MKKRNQFDSKDMTLLVVMLIIIYLVISWFGNNGVLFEEYNTNPSAETSQAAEQSPAP